MFVIESTSNRYKFMQSRTLCNAAYYFLCLSACEMRMKRAKRNETKNVSKLISSIARTLHSITSRPKQMNPSKHFIQFIYHPPAHAAHVRKEAVSVAERVVRGGRRGGGGVKGRLLRRNDRRRLSFFCITVYRKNMVFAFTSAAESIRHIHDYQEIHTYNAAFQCVFHPFEHTWQRQYLPSVCKWDGMTQ